MCLTENNKCNYNLTQHDATNRQFCGLDSTVLQHDRTAEFLNTMRPIGSLKDGNS
jgi:hypothetical protein